LGLSVHPSPSSRRHLHSIHLMSIIHHTKIQLKNFNKRGQLIFTLMRTFYEASAEEDWRRRHGGSDVRSGPFRRRARTAGRPATSSAFWGEKLSAILKARAAGGGERDRPAGTSEHTDRASDLLRRERERERVLLSEQVWPSFCGERASGVKRIRHRRDNNMCLRCEKKCDPRRQSKETHPTSTRLQYELIGNGLYSSLPIRQRLVTDLSSPLLIGHWSVTDFTSLLLIGLTFVTCSFNIRYKEFM
jgi:hypothetical protein